MIFAIEAAHLAAVRIELLRDCTIISESPMVCSNKILFVVDHPRMSGYAEPVIEEVRGEQPCWSDDMQRRFVFRGWRQPFVSLPEVAMRDEMAIESERGATYNTQQATYERGEARPFLAPVVPIATAVSDPQYRAAEQLLNAESAAFINSFPTPEGAASPVAAQSLECNGGKAVEMS